jgi:ribosomal protein S6--L-glutamate ligase
VTALRAGRIGFIERRHPPGYEGAVADVLVPLLRQRGAQVDVVHAEEGVHRLDGTFPWSLVVLKSGSAAALHLAAAAEARGIACVNPSEASRITQDKLASAAVLRRAGLPLPACYLAWLGPSHSEADATGPLHRETDLPAIQALDGRTPCRNVAPSTSTLIDLAPRGWVVKAARGSRGEGLWMAAPGELPNLAPTLPDGAYLLMERVPHQGDDLKVFVAGDWMAAINRPFPATTLSAKRGHPVVLPDPAAAAAREAGRLLGLRCYGCDFVSGPHGWTLVDVNAFPGYKGAAEAPEALAAEILQAAAQVSRIAS